MILLCFTGVDPFVPAPPTRYLSRRVVWESASDEAVGVVPEQIFTRTSGATGAEDAEQRPPSPGKI